MSLSLLAASVVILPLTLLMGTDRHASEPTRQAAAQKAPGPSDAGERVFKTHCSRCHTPPMSLSPRITGTVILHMRARARLSEHDEQVLLKFLAP